MKVESKCSNCDRYLGQVVYGDILCKCQHYNIIRPDKKTTLKVKSLYTPMATAPLMAS